MSRVGLPHRAAALASVALLTGCFGYNSSAKKWAYVGDTILVLGGGGVIAADLLTREQCTGIQCPSFDPPFGGATVAGVLLVTAGVFGMIFNATRPNAKSSSR